MTYSFIEILIWKSAEMQVNASKVLSQYIEQVRYGPYDSAHIAPSELSSKVNSSQGFKCSVVYVRQ